MFPSHDLFYRFVEDFDYVFSTFSKISKFDVRLEKMWLFLNTRKWAFGFQHATQKLGLEFPNVWAMEDFLYQELFIENKWKFPNIQSPLIVWKGE
jgi:hypothetical protein